MSPDTNPEKKPEPKYIPLLPETAGDGVPMIRATILRVVRKVLPKGEEIPMVEEAKVVTTEESGAEVINVNPDGSFDAREANRILPKALRKKVDNAAERARGKRRRHKRDLENRIK